MDAVPSTRVLRVLVITGVLIALAVGVFVVLKPFLRAVTWAAVLALVVWPLWRRFSLSFLRWGHRPNLAALLFTLLVGLMMFSVVIPVVYSLGAEMAEAGSGTRRWLERNLSRSSDELLGQIPFLSDRLRSTIARYLRNVGVGDREAVGLIVDRSDAILGTVGSTAKGVLRGVADLFLCLVILFFFLRDGKRVGESFMLTVRSVGGEIFERTALVAREAVIGSVYGVLATALVQGMLATIGYLAVSAPVPVLLGFATMIFSLIPFGTPVVYLPVAAFVGVEHGVWWGVGLALWGLLVVSSIDNLLRPIFISFSVRLPVILIFFGVIGGLLSFGFIGIIIGPMLIAVAVALWREWIGVVRAKRDLSPELR